MNFKFKPGDIVRYTGDKDEEIFIHILGTEEFYEAEPWDSDGLEDGPIYKIEILKSTVKSTFRIRYKRSVRSSQDFIDKNYELFLPHRK
jgi:hypothetical protein